MYLLFTMQKKIKLFGQRARKFKKIPGKKTHEIKLINFTKNVFDQIPFFAISKLAKNQFLNWGNCQKCNFTKKKLLRAIELLISRIFLPGLF